VTNATPLTSTDGEVRLDGASVRGVRRHRIAADLTATGGPSNEELFGDFRLESASEEVSRKVELCVEVGVEIALLEGTSPWEIRNSSRLYVAP
jgi:hypothetical protein